MKELSIFIDESGDFGEYSPHADPPGIQLSRHRKLYSLAAAGAMSLSIRISVEIYCL